MTLLGNAELNQSRPDVRVPSRLPVVCRSWLKTLRGACSSGLRPAVFVGRLSRGLREARVRAVGPLWRSPLYQIRETRPGGSAFRVSRRVHLSHRAGNPFCVPGGEPEPIGKSLAGAPVFAASPSLDPSRPRDPVVANRAYQSARAQKPLSPFSHKMSNRPRSVF